MSNRIEDCEYGDIQVKRYNLFGFLPLCVTKQNDKYCRIRVLGLPFLQKKILPHEDIYKLFYIFPILTIKKYIKFPYSKLEKHYEGIIENLKTKLKFGQRIKVCFMVIFDSVFPGKPLFEKMLNDDMFEPFILVIPDKSRGERYMYEQLEKTYKTLSGKYSCVYKSYDDEKNGFVDYSEKMDIVCSANPYENMTSRLYRIGKLCQKNILPIYFNYGYPAVSFARRVAALGSLAKMWKVFSESTSIVEEYAKSMKTHGANLVLAGYMKMDELANITEVARNRKRVIIAPHHTIKEKFSNTIGLSNFLVYADLFKELPKLYPQIDFIFRPHPLLKIALEDEEIWGEEKTKKYFDEIIQNPNLVYQDGGDYFETFANSDGIIHDCSSFLAEYLYTGKPVCYMLRNEGSIRKYFMENGEEMLNHCYHAYCKEDILAYLNDIILLGKDNLREKRVKFVDKNLKVNYPNVSMFVLKYLKDQITGNSEEV